MIEARLYGGRVQVNFNPKAHRYEIVGKDARPDGVTTICNAVVPKFDALSNWAGRVCVDHVRQGYLLALEEHGLPPAVSSSNGVFDRDAFLALCDEAETAHIRIRDSAGARGSDAHDYIEKILTGQSVELPDDPLVQASLNAFSQWQDEWPCEVMEAERIIYSEKLFYCGKTDVYGVVDGRPSIVDFKTGSGFYDDHPYQLTGYAVALEEELGMQIDDGYIVHLDKKTSSYKIYHVKIDDGMRDAWHLAVRHYKHLKAVKQTVKETKNGMAKGGSRRSSKAR